MDQGVLERWGVTVSEFNAATRTHLSDDALHAWLLAKTTPERIAQANVWLLHEKCANLDRQDAEEGVTV